MNQPSQRAWGCVAATALIFTIIAVAPFPSTADNKHSTQLKFTNRTDGRIRINVYNGNDHTLKNYHSQFKIGKKKEAILKCHGWGKHRCHLKILQEGKTVGKIAVPNGADCELWDDDDGLNDDPESVVADGYILKCTK